MKENFEPTYAKGVRYTISGENAWYFLNDEKIAKEGSVGLEIDSDGKLTYMQYDTDIVKSLPPCNIIILVNFEAKHKGFDYINN
jgi:hypothetical protein